MTNIVVTSKRLVARQYKSLYTMRLDLRVRVDFDDSTQDSV